MDDRIIRAREVARKLLRGRTTGDDLDDFACALLAYEGESPSTIQFAYLQEMNEELQRRCDACVDAPRLRGGCQVVGAFEEKAMKFLVAWTPVGGDSVQVEEFDLLQAALKYLAGNLNKPVLIKIENMAEETTVDLVLYA